MPDSNEGVPGIVERARNLQAQLDTLRQEVQSNVSSRWYVQIKDGPRFGPYYRRDAIALEIRWREMGIMSRAVAE